MHTLDVVFKQSSPPRLPQYKHTHTCMQNQKHSNTSCSYLACKAKYFLVCLKDSQFMSWLGICIVVRLADKSSKSGQGGKNVKKKKKKISISKTQSGYRGTLERYMPMDPDKREKQKKSERLGQDPKLCNKQIISQNSNQLFMDA